MIPVPSRQEEPDRRRRATEIFADFLEIPPDARSEFLQGTCGDDVELRREVEALLRTSPKAGTWFNQAHQEQVETDDAPTQARPRSADPIGRVISHYRLEKLLGAGGMGEVYAANDLALGRQAAIKVLPRDFNPEVRDRLLREAWASAKLQHPGIATFYEAGHADDVDFIAMEFVAGETLRKRFLDGPLDPKDALNIVAGVLEALVHAHFSGILHRDIKPENIMIMPDGSAKILDFGLARGLLMEDEDAATRTSSSLDDAEASEELTALIDETTRLISTQSGAEVDALQLTGLANLTRAGAVMGTFGYMPPEQLLGQSVDARADVFAVGAVLYEALSGFPAFPGNTLQEKMHSVLQRDPSPLSRPDMPAELDAVVSRALARNPAVRYTSAAAFLSDLRGLAQTDRGSWLPVRLAVVDFQDLTGNEEEPDWMSTALPEALAASLTEIPGITRIPPAKVAAARAAGGSESSELEVGLRVSGSAVLHGSVKRSGDLLRADAKLSDVATGGLIFEDVVRGTEDEVLAMPDRFTRAVAEMFDAEVPRTAKPSIMTEAYKCYVQAHRIGARVGAGRGDFEIAAKLAERAVELVPDYGTALAFLANLHAVSFNFTSDPKVLEKAVDYAQRAIDADPELADAHLWMGYALGFQEKHLAGYRSLLQAMRLDPSSFLAPYFASSIFVIFPVDQLKELLEESGQTSIPDDVHRWRRLEAVRLYQRSLKLNPKFSWAWLGLGWTQVEFGSFNQARWCLNKAIELEPTSVPRVAGCAGYLAECLRRSAEIDEARTKFIEALEELERTDHMYRDTFRGFFLCGLGRAALDQSDEEAAKAAFTQAVLHIRGRSAARCGGHVLVQGLAGLTRSGAGKDHFEEARTLFETRAGFDFGVIWGCTDDVDLLELAKAAEALGRGPEAETLFERAREMGSSEALAREDSGP